MITGTNSLPEKTFTVAPTIYGKISTSRRCVLIGFFSLPDFAALISSISFLLLSFIPLVNDRLVRAGNNLSYLSKGKVSNSF